jgi:hypothetical protein
MQRFQALETLPAAGPVRATLKNRKGSRAGGPTMGHDANCPGWQMVASPSWTRRLVQFRPSMDPCDADSSASLCSSASLSIQDSARNIIESTAGT